MATCSQRDGARRRGSSGTCHSSPAEAVDARLAPYAHHHGENGRGCHHPPDERGPHATHRHSEARSAGDDVGARAARPPCARAAGAPACGVASAGPGPTVVPPRSAADRKAEDELGPLARAAPPTSRLVPGRSARGRRRRGNINLQPGTEVGSAGRRQGRASGTEAERPRRQATE